ncbi:hypothetical protein BDW22DRAFT_1483929 [Trametopsis cervina]|nr:hypothetical protein BDW22DRAFT_1483929 [Trametopsis cervina]
MRTHASGNTSKSSEVPLWNTLHFDILSPIFECVAQSFPVQEYDQSATLHEYTESEVALKQCFLALTLVCQFWHAAAQPYLLRVLSIRISASPTAESTTDSKGLLDILQWLDLAQPLLPTCVRHLRLIMADIPEESESDGCDPALLHALLRRFRGVRTVELLDLLFDSEQLTTYASTLAAAHTEAIDLDTLILTYGFEGETALLCMTWFGRVSRLSIRNDSYPSTPGSADSTLDHLPARLAARSLVIDTDYLPMSVRECLHRSPTFGSQGTLRAFRFMVSASPVEFIHTEAPFMHPASQILEELELDLTIFSLDVADSTYSEGGIDLSEMLRLRALTLRVSLLGDTLPAWAAVYTFIGALCPPPPSHVNGPSTAASVCGVQCVTLALHNEYGLPYRKYGAQFAQVDTALAGVPTIEQCTLDLRNFRNGSGTLEECKTWLRDHMAGLHARGVLRFVA